MGLPDMQQAAGMMAAASAAAAAGGMQQQLGLEGLEGALGLKTEADGEQHRGHLGGLAWDRGGAGGKERGNISSSSSSWG